MADYKLEAFESANHTRTHGSTIRITIELEARLQRRRQWFRSIEEPEPIAYYTVTIGTSVGRAVASYPLRAGSLSAEPPERQRGHRLSHVTYRMAADEGVALHALLQRALTTIRPTDWHDAHLLATLQEWTSWRLPRQAFDAEGHYRGLRCLSLECDSAPALLIFPFRTREQAAVA